MAIDKESKTEEPTSRRLEDAKKKGDVPRSKEMASSVGLLFTLLFFVLFMPYFGSTMFGCGEQTEDLSSLKPEENRGKHQHE